MINVYLDTENVAGADVSGAALLPEDVKVYVYLRAGTSKPKRLLQGLAKLNCDNVEREVIGNSANAMDFQIVWDVAHTIAQHPKSLNIIVSKDAGYTAILNRAFIEGNVLRMVPDLSEVTVLKLLNNFNSFVPAVSMADFMDWYRREKESEVNGN